MDGLKLLLLLLAVAIGCTAQKVTGYLDAANCEMIAGWSMATDHPTEQLRVLIFSDGDLVAYQTAALHRSDVGSHAFHFAPPAELLDGRPHKLRAESWGHRLLPERTLICKKE